MKSHTSYLRAGATLSALSALTTAILMYGPNAPATDGFDAAQSLHNNGLYLYKKWVLFLHPQFAFLAALAVGITMFRDRAFLMVATLFYLGLWAFTEVSQQAYIIDALNQMWRPAYLAAEGESRELWRTLITGMRGISDSQYFVVIFAFGVGTLLFGFAFTQRDPLNMFLRYGMIAIGIMSLVSFLSYYAGLIAAGSLVGAWYGYVYGPLQIAVRLALALWLWREASAHNQKA
ncbi:hypothetical protein [Kordiimonas sp.]|uniref:hypothetical protein n=1 Tax=Kordiimonas sp. TaxID=1970157 RepID=UPI003A914409